ncbi:MAG: hypothetical protein Q7U73_06815 [Rubrivivax sp.]|nr:hypothetical protein [Rubrivivax sp.]
MSSIWHAFLVEFEAGAWPVLALLQRERRAKKKVHSINYLR